MNKKAPFGKKMFFNRNINKIRKTIMEYLREEGVKVELEEGLIVVTSDDVYYIPSAST